MEIKFKSANYDTDLDALLSTVQCNIVPRKGETAIIGSKMLEVVGVVYNFDMNFIEVYVTDWGETEKEDTDLINQQ